MRWNIETSQKVKAPDFLDVVTIADLRRQVNELALTYHPRKGSPALGELTYRYEHDHKDWPFVVHVYFTNKDGKLARFMRLRRV